MLRRIALALALVSGSLQADDRSRRESSEREELDQERGLTLNPDGTVASWGLLRRVLPDLEDEHVGPAWLETPTRPGSTGKLGLDTIGGRVVLDPVGVPIGVVRGCLLNPIAGRVLALDVEIGPSLGVEPRRVALPWANVTIRAGTLRYDGDAEWLRAAPACAAE